jgi:accessory gene regulator protein AgrB
MFVLVSYFVKNVLVLKLFWNNLMAVLGQQLWLFLPKDVDHLCILETCSVSAARNMGILLLIVLKNSALIARRRVTLSKNVVFDPRIVRPKHFRLRFLFRMPQLLPHLSLLPMRPLFLPFLHPITALQQWCNRF